MAVAPDFIEFINTTHALIREHEGPCFQDHVAAAASRFFAHGHGETGGGGGVGILALEAA